MEEGHRRDGYISEGIDGRIKKEMAICMTYETASDESQRASVRVGFEKLRIYPSSPLLGQCMTSSRIKAPSSSVQKPSTRGTRQTGKGDGLTGTGSL